MLTPLFFHHEDVDPDDLACLCIAHGYKDARLVQEDKSREGYGYVVRDEAGAYFIHERRSGAVYRVWPGRID